MQVELLQNEMFGHEPQAFTGAAGSRPGLIQEADHGTLFLDEIDSLPAQAMLLRFLQEGEFKPLGSSKTKRADVRVIAATNLEVDEALRAHVLREDLYWRLSVMTIALPPLRERRDDVPLLANFFRSKWATRFERDIHGISEEAMRLLMLHDWPGNVRELENTIERSVIFARSSTIEANDLSFSCQPLRQEADMSFNDLRSRFVYHFEETYLRNVLDSSNGNISKVAQASGMSRRTVRRLLEKHRIKG
jgi:DNA-binding NtrC family response regulator